VAPLNVYVVPGSVNCKRGHVCVTRNGRSIGLPWQALPQVIGIIFQIKGKLSAVAAMRRWPKLADHMAYLPNPGYSTLQNSLAPRPRQDQAIDQAVPPSVILFKMADPSLTFESFKGNSTTQSRSRYPLHKSFLLHTQPLCYKIFGVLGHAFL